jgi:tetratricopeptide (TPR) repeat protein
MGHGYYYAHPALPWFFRGMFEKLQLKKQSHSKRSGNKSISPFCSFAEAIGVIGSIYHNQYGAGKCDVIFPLVKEEGNLLFALRLARSNRMWDTVTRTMQGLHVLYEHTGRLNEWKCLVEKIIPDFINSTNEEPLQGREDQWSLITDYRVRIAIEERKWNEAERLQYINVCWCRRHTPSYSRTSIKTLNKVEINKIRTLAVSIELLGSIQQRAGKEDCVQTCKEALKINIMIGEFSSSASCCHQLGNAFLLIPSIRNLNEARKWFNRSLKLRREPDRLGRGKIANELGYVALEEAKETEKSSIKWQNKISEALKYYMMALEIFPPDSITELAITHNQIGMIYFEKGETDRSILHYNHSLQYREMKGNACEAGNSRFNIALSLSQCRRFTDALDYARSALGNYESYGVRPKDRIEETKNLIQDLESLIELG